MKKILLEAGLLAVCLLLAVTLSAQQRWQLLVRPGANFPTSDMGTTALKTGVGIDGALAYKLQPHLFATAGWGWTRFAHDAANSKVDFNETGYTAGLRFAHPITGTRVGLIVAADAVYKHIEMENGSGDVVSDTGHGWGWQAEAGVSVPLSSRWSLQPTVRYHALTRDLNFGDGSVSVDLRYLSAGVGIAWSF